ncbi:MAG: hypothetical protein ACE5R6_02015 [Candidatus Heimdallarchaeota archaeon]
MDEWGDGVVESHVLVWCGDCDVLVIHGDGVRLEAAVNKYGGANTKTLIEVRQGLIEKGHLRFPAITEKDWLMTSHFDSGMCNATYQVCGWGHGGARRSGRMGGRGSVPGSIRRRKFRSDE